MQSSIKKFKTSIIIKKLFIHLRLETHCPVVVQFYKIITITEEIIQLLGLIEIHHFELDQSRYSEITAAAVTGQCVYAFIS